MDSVPCEAATEPARRELSAVYRFGFEPSKRGASIAIGSALGLGVLAVAVLPRLGATPLWLDEAYSLGVVHQFATGTRRTGDTMIAYYALLWVWARVGESPAWLRSLSLLCTVVALPLVAAVGRRIGGNRLAVIAPPLFAASYYVQEMAANVRSYSMEILVVTACWYGVIRGVESGDDSTAARRWWWLVAVLAPLGVLVHGFFVLFVCAMAVTVVLSPSPRRDSLRAAPALLTTAAVAVVLTRSGIGEVGTWVPRTRAAYLVDVLREYAGFAKPVTFVSIAAIVGLITVIVVDLARPARSAPPSQQDRLEQWRVWVPLVWLVVPPLALLVVSIVRPSFVTRYVAGITPAVALCVGLALCRLSDWFGARRAWSPGRSGGALVVVGALLVVSWAASSADTVATGPHAHWNEIADIVADQGRAGDGILLYSQNIRPPFEAAWSQRHRMFTPQVVDMSRPLGETRRFDTILPVNAKLRSRVLSYQRVWSIDRGPGRPGAQFFAPGGPMGHEYRLARFWTFTSVVSPHVVRVRLYVRNGSGG